jgi:hypothetical protein
MDQEVVPEVLPAEFRFPGPLALSLAGTGAAGTSAAGTGPAAGRLGLDQRERGSRESPDGLAYPVAGSGRCYPFCSGILVGGRPLPQ